MGTLIRAHLAAFLAALAFAATARADAVEGVLMPGKVIAGHAKLEALWGTVKQAQQDIFGALSDGELEVFKKALRLGMASR